ncbi:uncharacterized protein [Cicer arietinum]|uniref:uncharacterized protein n=1 Tax=Cicer arietinum TaxID=3827 RepID=UPI003CC60BDE
MVTWDDSDDSDLEETEEANICLMANTDETEVGCQNIKKKPWFLDSGCSRHMKGDKRSFPSFTKTDGGLVTFGNNDQAQIKGKGTIGNKKSAKINDVQYVERFKHNLLSISQLCDNGFEVVFKPNICEFRMANSGETLFSASKRKNLYVLYIEELPAESCFMSINKDKWIWHKCAGHISMKTSSNLSKVDLVKGLPKINFDKDKIHKIIPSLEQGEF